MTKPQIWVAAFLTLFILLFIIGRLTKEEETFTPPLKQNFSGETSNANLTAEQLMTNFGCSRCHGVDYSGTTQGPALVDIGEKFSREDLIAYFRNPQSFFNIDRFKEYRQKYPNSMMPDFGNKDVKELGKIADFLINRK
ncbi:c-type cytochrome [Bacteroidota bacterium]